MKTVTFDDATRHMILACKQHYTAKFGSIVEALRAIYRKYYWEAASDKEADYVIYQRLLGVVFRYNLLSSEQQFTDFVIESVFGKQITQIFYSDSLAVEYPLYYALINVLSTWKVRGRDDGVVFDLGNADFREE